MSRFTEIRAAINTRLEAVPGIGKIQPFERFSKNNRTLKEFYAVGNKIDGGFVRRVRRNSISPNDTVFERTTHWEIVYIRSWRDSLQSSDKFNELLDAIAEAFETDVTLGGVVATTKENGQAAIQLINSVPAMFAGILVHYAVMTLTTKDIHCI